MRSAFIPFLFLWSLSMAATGQEGLRDSLLRVIASSKSDTVVINAYITLTEDAADSITLTEIAEARARIDRIYPTADKRLQKFLDESRIYLSLNEAAYYFVAEDDSDKAIALTQKCITEVGNLNNEGLTGTCYNNLAVIQYSIGQSDECLGNLKTALVHRERAGDSTELNQAYANLGYILFHTGHQVEALEYLYKSLKLCDELEDYAQKATTLHYLGQVYNQQEDYERELRNSVEAMRLYEKYGTKREISSGYNNLGTIYQTLGNYDSAFFYHNKALQLRRELDYRYGIANSQNNLGDLYLELKQFDKARQCFTESMDIWKNSDDSESLATLYVNLGRLYKALQLPDSVIHYCVQGLRLAQEVRSLDDERLHSELLAWASEEKGDFRQAFNYFRQFHLLSDSLFNDKIRRETERRTLNYEFERKEAQLVAEQDKRNAVHQAQMLSQRRLRNVSLGAGALALVLAAVMMNRYRIKRNAARALAAQNVLVEAAKERAEKSERFRQQFLANMSHEIRTPMNAIIGLSKLLEDGPAESVAKRYIHAIRQSGENLMVVLNDILDLSKLEAGKFVLEKRIFNPAMTLEHVKQTFESRASERGLVIAVDIAPAVPNFVRGDEARLVQVLNNLVANAIRFSHDFSGRANVISEDRTIRMLATVDEKEVGEKIRFAVADRGIGIKQENLGSIFEPFRQVHEGDARLYGGSGLGLAISKNLVAQMGGELNVNSEWGRGSEFYFDLPLSKVTEEEVRQIPVESLPRAIEVNSRPLRVLLAEDNDYNAMVTEDTLRKYYSEIKLTRVVNGIALLFELSKVSKSELPDLVLMDVQMPGMDGYEATCRLRSEFSDPVAQIPVLALTASVIKSDLDKCLEAGMNGYLAKPFDDRDLVRSIEDTLARGKVQQAVKRSTRILSDKFRQLFLSVVPARMAELQDSVDRNDWDQVRERVHRMRPQLADAGVDFSEIEYQRLEDPTLKEETTEATVLLKKLTEAIDQRLNELRNE